MAINIIPMTPRTIRRPLIMHVAKLELIFCDIVSILVDKSFSVGILMYFLRDSRNFLLRLS